MVERLRALLERPLDPSVARALLVLALAASIGFAAVAMLAGFRDRPTAVAQAHHQASSRRAGNDHVRAAVPASATEIAGQDRQDRPGNLANRRALEEAAAHRALQHVPYRAGGVSIEMVDVRRGKALLRVEAPTVGVARRGWGAFLRRFHDPGSAYAPRFEREPLIGRGGGGGRRG